MQFSSIYRFRSIVYCWVLCFYCLFSSYDVLAAGHGYILRYSNGYGLRPMLFFSDELQLNALLEIQQNYQFLVSEKRVSKINGSISTPLSLNIIWEFTTSPVYICTGFSMPAINFETVPGNSRVQFNFDNPVKFHEGSSSDSYGVSFGFHFLSHFYRNHSTGNDSAISSKYILNNYGDVQCTIYYIPESMNLTEDLLREMPWGWWGDVSRFGHNNYTVTSINSGLTDNPAFAPDNPINPVTGTPYTPADYQWNYDSNNGRWVGHNRWLDMTEIPTNAQGPTGQWRFGKPPSGSVHGDVETPEWYWDGTRFEDVNLPGDNPDPWTGDSESVELDTGTLNLIAAIEQNTRNSAASLLGYSGKIDGLNDRLIQSVDKQELIRQELISGRSELMSCLNGHHSYTEYRLNNIMESASTIAGYQDDIIDQLSTGFGGQLGALNGMSGTLTGLGETLSSMYQNAVGMNDFLESIDFNQQGIAQTLSGSDTRLANIETVVGETIAAGLTRMEGHLKDINDIQNYEWDLWASEVMGWSDSRDQSLTKLQYLCDLGDTLKAHLESIGQDITDNRAWWELEKIRWVARDNQLQASADDLADNTADVADNTAAAKDKLDNLIDAVSGIPPVDIPEVDLSNVEQKLSDIANGVSQSGNSGAGILSSLGNIGNDMQAVKNRLASIDNALNSRLEPAPVGDLELHSVQESVRDELENMVKDMHSKFTNFESGVWDRLGFVAFGVGRQSNPDWIDQDFSIGGLEWDMSVNWTDDKWDFITNYRWIWILIERFCIWLGCLKMCLRSMLEV